MMVMVMMMMVVIFVVVTMILDTGRACLTASLVVVVVVKFGVIFLCDAAVVSRRSMKGPGSPQAGWNIQVSEVE